MLSFGTEQFSFRKAFGRNICRQIVLPVLLLGVVMQGHAQPPESLSALVVQLQLQPQDDALREQVIRLARATKPEPAIPSEALQLENAGLTLFKKAKTPQDYQVAVHEYEQALRLAPWVASLYFELGEAYEKMGDATVGDLWKGKQVRQSCSMETYDKESRNFDGYARAKKNFEFYLLAKANQAEHDAAIVRQRIEERRMRFEMWRHQWDAQCCAGCGGKRDSEK
ncbi:MAG: hypothetical protein Q7T25_03290 [Sideroxyarcus sp.]|nr:hypothetical protein [Sideroxyarcus sp.]